ncbi:MAG: histidinol-phosphate transaminase [Deltaproteobacteria bacterium]|nr:MAG: histidinol-phosphate transaminase [Deltaproteobacteria bacterium]
MGIRVSDNIAELQPYPPGKPLEELEREYGISDSIKLASNENPLGSSPRALEAVRIHLENLRRYPDGSGFYLKQRLSRLLGVPQTAIVLGNGSNEIIDLAIRTFVQPGDEVLMSDPTFLVYRLMTQAVGGRPVQVSQKGFAHDLKSMAAAVSSRTRMVFLDNPNNPSGTVISREDFEAFRSQIPADVLIVLDEAYIEFADPELTVSGTEYVDDLPSVITLRTFSKAYGLAGLRIGYGIMPPEVAGYVNRVRQPFNVNSLAQVAALAALDDGQFLQETLQVVREGLAFLYKELANMQLRALPTQTNFLLIDVGGDGKKIYEAMLRRGVIVRAMSSYGLNNYIRISVGKPDENRRFLKALKEVIGETGVRR